MAEPGGRDDPFALLGLPARAGLSDEDVRAAWRRIAAATHPDREDGGDPARFGAVAAAYVTLRTSFGRGEALADLGGVAGTGAATGPRRARRHRSGRRRTGHGGTAPAVPAGLAAHAAGLAARVATGGRGLGLALRVIVAAGAGALAFLAAGWSPATAGVLAGALTWLVSARLRG